jgi:hypothetical protein
MLSFLLGSCQHNQESKTNKPEKIEFNFQNSQGPERALGDLGKKDDFNTMTITDPSVIDTPSEEIAEDLENQQFIDSPAPWGKGIEPINQEFNLSPYRAPGT